MKLTISAIGKMKSGPEQELFSRYLTRAKSIGAGIGFPSVSLVEYSESKSSNVSIRKDQEADLILASSGQAIILAFDENGKTIQASNSQACWPIIEMTARQTWFLPLVAPMVMEMHCLKRQN